MDGVDDGDAADVFTVLLPVVLSPSPSGPTHVVTLRGDAESFLERLRLALTSADHRVGVLRLTFGETSIEELARALGSVGGATVVSIDPV